MHISKLRKNQKHCKHGHLFDEANTYYTKYGTRHCRKCNKIRDLASKKANPELYSKRRVASVKKWQEKNPDYVQNFEEKRKLKKYDLTIEKYNKILAFQYGVCAICNEKCKSGRKLAVDHNHVTGKVRGLLCMNCNNGLGRFNDNPALLIKAIKYLETKTITLS
jgi:uncharacterized Rmd1/YagE family protein